MIVCNMTNEGKLIDRALYKSGKLPIMPTNAVKIVSETENTITDSAEEYVHAVEFDGGFVFEDNYFSLLPKEQKT